MKNENTKPELETLTLEHLSYSQLSTFKKGPKYYQDLYITKKRERTTGPALIFGSLLDCLLFTPKDFDNNFKIVEKVEVTGKLGLFIENLAKIEQTCDEERSKNLLIFDFTKEELYENAYRTAGFKEAIKNVIADFNKPIPQKYYEYQKELAKGEQGKKFVSNEEYLKAQQIISMLNTNTFTQKVFKKPGFSQFKIEWYHQLFPEIPFISILDYVYIDDKNKKIYIIDLKTTGENVEHFDKAIEKFNYGIQAALYCQAVTYAINNNLMPFSKQLENYECVYQILAVESFGECRPLLFKMSEETLYNCYEQTANLITDLRWHVMNNKWSYSKKVYENNGVLSF